MRFSLACVVLVACACGFREEIPARATLQCASGADCPPDAVCFDGTCVDPDAPCLTVEGREATAERDGNACGTDRICVAGACVVPRCGDGVASGDEACDDGGDNSDVAANACRTDCALPHCGDGAVDTGEVCDGDPACSPDCGKIEVCGDAERDTNEACDDGNLNPRDGCDACRVQRWQREVLVQGSVEGNQALEAGLAYPAGIALDPLGRLLIADSNNNRVRRVDVDGTIMTVAGNGALGGDGDGGPATSATLFTPFDVAADALGRILIADANNGRIRRVELDGSIVTVAGGAPGAGDADGTPATQAELPTVGIVALDAQGRILFADASNRVRRVEFDGTLETVAGTGSPVFSGEGGPATEAGLTIADLVVDVQGRLWIADYANSRVRRLDEDGTLHTMAGNGESGDSGDGGPALDASLSVPNDLAIDSLGRVLIGQNGNPRIRRLELDGTISAFAGDGNIGYGGDGGPALAATFFGPLAMAIDDNDEVLIADLVNNRVRRVTADGTIDTVVGSGSYGFAGDGGDATGATLSNPRGLAVDASGRVVIADTFNQRIRRIEPGGLITSILGNGNFVSFAGGPPPFDALAFPFGVTVDDDLRVWVADTFANRVLRIDVDGTVSLIAGTGGAGFSGDGGPALDAELSGPTGVAVDALGNVFIADASNARVRRVDVNGDIDTVAGTGSFDFSGDGGPATDAGLSAAAIACDASGTVFVADHVNNRIRKIAVNGTITTAAGIGTSGFSGDGGPAGDAELAAPMGVAVDARGRLLIADTDNGRVRRVEIDGTVDTLAGDPSALVAGDGGLATAALLMAPASVASGPGEATFVLESGASRARRIDVDGVINTVAGGVHPTGPGPFARAQLYGPRALALVPDMGLLSVGEFGRVMAIDVDAARVSVVSGHPGASPDAHGLARTAPLLNEPSGVAWHPERRAVYITEKNTGDVRVLTVDPTGDGVIDPSSAWTSTTLDVGLAGPAGLAWDAAADSFLVVDEDAHCVRRMDSDGALLAVAYGQCGSLGSFPGFLQRPTSVAVSAATGALYIADTGNHRVLRVLGADASVVVGDGSVSSAGEGAPARLFPVNAPRQLALDEHGNLFVASTTTVRMVANINGNADADGEDIVSTLYGAGDRAAFPESVSFCINALVLGGDTLYVADGCQGFLVGLQTLSTP